MDLSGNIYNFLKELKRAPEDYSMSNVIDELDNFCSDASDLENKLEEAEGNVADLQNEIEDLKVRLSIYEEG